MLTAGAFVVVLGVLIFVHELGHYLAARAVGIYVIRFSFGLGPKTPLAVRIGETEYCLSWVPFGGYVKMAGLEEEGPGSELEGPREDAHVPPGRTFDAKPLWARIMVISAGVVMNAAFAVVVYAGLAARYGVPKDTSTLVGSVDATALPVGGAPLAQLRAGDRIIRIDGDTMTGWRAIGLTLLTSPQAPMRIEVANRPEPVIVDVPLSDQEGRQQLLNAIEPWHEPVLGDMSAGKPAEGAGLRSGDRVISANGDTVLAWERLVRVIEAHPGAPIALVVQRGASMVPVTVTPESTEVRGDAGETLVVGKIGAARYQELERFGVAGAVREGFGQAWEAGALIVFTLKGLVMGQLSPRDLGGPILIGQMSGEAARLGLRPFLSFLALFSVNLAVLNLLPIPVLDGGHLVFLLIEGVRGKPLSVAARQRWMTVGLVVVLMLMLLAVYNDVLRLFR